MDPKPHSKTLADERTCWTKASHWSESQRIRPCFSAWVSDVLGKKSSSTSKLSANTASWTTVVDALWAMFQYQIKNHMSLSAGRCASFKSPTRKAWTHGTTTSVLAFTATSLGSFNLCQQSDGRQATSVGHVLAQLVRGERSRKHSCLRKDWNSQGRRPVRAVPGTRTGKI